MPVTRSNVRYVCRRLKHYVGIKYGSSSMSAEAQIEKLARKVYHSLDPTGQETIQNEEDPDCFSQDFFNGVLAGKAAE